MLTTPWVPFKHSLKSGDREFWNAVMSFSSQWLQVPGKDNAVVFGQAETPDRSQPAHRLANGKGDRVMLICASFPFHTMFGLDMVYADIAAVEEPLRGALYDGVIATVAGAMPDDVVSDLVREATGPLCELCDVEEVQSLWWVAVRLSGISPEDVVFTVGLKPEVLVNTLRIDGIGAQAVWSGLGQHIFVQAYYVAGRTSLSLREFRDLGVGDAVMFGRSGTSRHINIEDTTFEFSRNEDSWLVAGSFRIGSRDQHESGNRYMGDFVNNIETPAAEDDGPASVGEGNSQAGTNGAGAAVEPEGTLDDILPVTLEFGFGEHRVALAEIESWQAGSLIELNIPDPDEGIAVVVRANGQVIGSGDVVRIDERIAVRISKLFFART